MIRGSEAPAQSLTPGPAAFNRVDMDIYKPRAPKFTMGLKTTPVGKGMGPGPAEYSPGKVRQPDPNLLHWTAFT
ncbi:hypothetical protein Nmel_008386 [Mimus melanotis]